MCINDHQTHIYIVLICFFKINIFYLTYFPRVIISLLFGFSVILETVLCSSILHSLYSYIRGSDRRIWKGWKCKAALTIPDEGNNSEICNLISLPMLSTVWLPIFSSTQEGLWPHSPLFPRECMKACKWQEIEFCKSCCKFHWPLFVTVEIPLLSHEHMKFLLDCHVYFLYLLIRKFVACVWHLP